MITAPLHMSESTRVKLAQRGEIDRIISRTLAYSVVILLLGLAYVGVVLSIQTVLPIDDDSPLIVAVSTLAVVALFRPLQSRVREVVGRRVGDTVRPAHCSLWLSSSGAGA